MVHWLIIIIVVPRQYLQCYHIWREAICESSLERKSVTSRWPPTHRPSCKL